jgi:tRNA-(ms[2]io[6]A)-hydroxylase|tara:strand:- start:3754 stop:4329 length:576 start_codon:yes stop_codon:yes gene_type:complete
LFNVLNAPSPKAWLEAVIGNFDEFLIDHASAERKASAVALSIVAHYPDRIKLVEEMTDLALEELNHYRQVIKLMLKRGLIPSADEKDPYVNAILGHFNRGPEQYFLDRLLTAALIEARGAERFELISENLEDPELATFYRTLSQSEQNHYHLFIHLANHYFPESEVTSRWQEWLDIEVTIMNGLAIRPRLH